MSTEPAPHVVVVGGGIAGLAAAWTLCRSELARNPLARSAHPRVTVLEADARLGGKIRTSDFAGFAVEEGPDAFLARVPWATRLCHELGLDNELTSPAQQQAWIWHQEQLDRFPSRTLLGVPSSLVTLAKSGLISRRGTLRAGLDYLLPRRRTNNEDDPTIAQVIESRLGTEVLETLVDPLLGGINAGDVRRLSIASAAPQLAEAISDGRSVMWAARDHLSSHQSNDEEPKPIFQATRGGLTTLVTALEKQLDEYGVSIRTNAPVTRLHQHPDHAWDVTFGPADSLDVIEVDGVVLAIPAFEASELLQNVNRSSATALSQIDYASVAMIRLAYDTADVPGRLEGSGFVVPASEGRLVTACSWVTSKWGELANHQTVILRASVGRSNDTRFTNLSDDELIAAVHKELTVALGLRGKPTAADVIVWNDALPQYEVGHASRVHTAEVGLEKHPGIALAGAAYRGLGIPACIHSGSEAAEHVLAQLGQRQQLTSGRSSFPQTGTRRRASDYRRPF